MPEEARKRFERRTTMRVRSLIAVATVCLSAGFVSGCNNQQQAEGQPAPAQEQQANQTGYDLSPEGNARFLADYAMKEGVQIHPTGLMYRVIKAGTGATPQSGNDTVTVSYRGNLIDGTEFDKTPPGETIDFPTGGLIQGWVIALQMMKEGDEWELVIPSQLGYGEQGAGGVIPPNQTLVFNMVLHKVTPAP
jgi:FKBP-type peptidyl-prolyl cis-trans isomerase